MADAISSGQTTTTEMKVKGRLHMLQVNYSVIRKCMFFKGNQNFNLKISIPYHFGVIDPTPPVMDA